MVVAICGAEGSGKHDLVTALSKALCASSLNFTIIEPLNGDASAADLTLLCGLEPPPGYQASGLLKPDLRVAEDSRLRTALIRSGVSFQVIYGLGDARLENAMRAISALEKTSPCVDATGDTAFGVTPSPKKWRWACDKCSDPQCEHTLFTQLAK